jgi:Osmosensitive K+ channel histidine kinase
MNIYDENRPDPDELLASLKEQEDKSKLGKLKIFFGMCAGVGKTYTMLQAAHLEKGKKMDVVIGYVETHGRPETEKLVEGLEIIPPYQINYRDTLFREVDIDAIIARKPQVVLIDELAHTNAPGSRHTKRYQDVQELINNGIDVYTTLNVQHIESRTDTVTQITGVSIRETVPDDVLEAADEIELVDLTADELLQRLAEGKVYTPERSQEAIRNFFRKGNITALREMSLRLVADRVDKQLREYMQTRRIPGPWKSGLRLMVALGPSPYSAWLIRWAKSLSYTMDASLIAVYVQKEETLSPENQEQLNKNIALAKQLGAHYLSTTDTDLSRGLLNIAQRENATHILVGKSQRKGLHELLRRDLVSKLIHDSGDIDIYVVGAKEMTKRQKRFTFTTSEFRSSPKAYLTSAAVMLLAVLLCYLCKGFVGYQVVSYILLFAVSLVALFFSTGPILLAAALGALLWDFFFINPPLTFYIAKPEDLMMFGTFFSVAIINGVLTARLRSQQRLARDREQRTSALYELSKVLASASGTQEVIEQAVTHIRKYFDIESAILLSEDEASLQTTLFPVDSKIELQSTEHSIAAWVYKHVKKAGKYTDTLPATDLTFYPLKGKRINTGVLLVKPQKPFRGELEMFWDTFRVQLTNALERELLNEIARRASVLNESEKLYKTLFNSISHELRIPVSTLMGASETLLQKNSDQKQQQQLAQEIFLASDRLNRLIENLLNMSRLESDRITPSIDWHDVHDLANKVISNLHDELKPFHTEVIIPENMPLVKFDFGLMEQVVHNLVYNATQHSQPTTTIRIKFYYDHHHLVIQVMDRGTGFPPESIPYLCNKFYRANNRVAGGIGLGLSIVKGFVDAHQGTIRFENRAHGGALITIKIPTGKYTIENKEDNETHGIR